MISASWIEKRRTHWTRLERLVEASGRSGVSTLSPSELQELALLYRQIAADLATVREDPSSKTTALYLNQLLGRAHNLIYMGRKTQRRGILKFFINDYPAIFRETFADTFAAFAIFLAGAVAGALMGIADPSFCRHLLSPGMVDTIEHHKMWTDSIVTIKATASSYILTNNISVAFATFALGITAGIGTVYMMVRNGVLIGVVGVACWREGMSLPLWSFVAAHGVLELPAIFIAGGAGFGIARGLLFPGYLPRKESLIRAGRRSVQLILGTIPMLLVAGFIEGFISPTAIPRPVKFTLAAGLFTLLVLYLLHKPVEKTPAKSPAPANPQTVPVAQLR